MTKKSAQRMKGIILLLLILVLAGVWWYFAFCLLFFSMVEWRFATEYLCPTLLSTVAFWGFSALIRAAVRVRPRPQRRMQEKGRTACRTLRQELPSYR